MANGVRPIFPAIGNFAVVEVRYRMLVVSRQSLVISLGIAFARGLAAASQFVLRTHPTRRLRRGRISGSSGVLESGKIL